MSYRPSTTWRLELAGDSPRPDAVLPGLDARLGSDRECDAAIASLVAVLADEARSNISWIAKVAATDSDQGEMQDRLRSLFSDLRRPGPMNLARLVELSANPALATEARAMHALLMGLTLVVSARLEEVAAPTRAAIATRGVRIAVAGSPASHGAELMKRIDQVLAGRS